MLGKATSSLTVLLPIGFSTGAHAVPGVGGETITWSVAVQVVVPELAVTVKL